MWSHTCSIMHSDHCFVLHSLNCTMLDRELAKSCNFLHCSLIDMLWCLLCSVTVVKRQKASFMSERNCFLITHSQECVRMCAHLSTLSDTFSVQYWNLSYCKSFLCFELSWCWSMCICCSYRLHVLANTEDNSDTGELELIRHLHVNVSSLKILLQGTIFDLIYIYMYLKTSSLESFVCVTVVNLPTCSWSNLPFQKAIRYSDPWRRLVS